MEEDILLGYNPERERRLERRALGRYLAAVGFTMLVFLLAALSTSLPVGLLRGYWQNRGVPVTQTMMQLVNMASYCYSLLLPLLFMVLFQGPGRTSRPLFPLDTSYPVASSMSVLTAMPNPSALSLLLGTP